MFNCIITGLEIKTNLQINCSYQKIFDNRGQFVWESATYMVQVHVFSLSKRNSNFQIFMGDKMLKYKCTAYM